MTKAKARLRAKANLGAEGQKAKIRCWQTRAKFPAGALRSGNGLVKKSEHEHQRQELGQGKKGRGAVGISRSIGRRRPQSTKNTLWRVPRTAVVLPGASPFPAITASPVFAHDPERTLDGTGSPEPRCRLANIHATIQKTGLRLAAATADSGCEASPRGGSLPVNCRKFRTDCHPRRPRFNGASLKPICSDNARAAYRPVRQPFQH